MTSRMSRRLALRESFDFEVEFCLFPKQIFDGFEVDQFIEGFREWIFEDFSVNFNLTF